VGGGLRVQKSLLLYFDAECEDSDDHLKDESERELPHGCKSSRTQWSTEGLSSHICH